MQATREILESLAGLKLGQPQGHLNLALFPLIDENDLDPGYLLLDDALERKLARITEVSADGSVPELAFENGSAEKILLVDGDELVGAKQNRVLNVSILVAGGRKLVIPVSCVEQGRWSYRRRDFFSAKRALFAKARAKKMRQVTESLRARQERRSNQSEVWADVADKECDRERGREVARTFGSGRAPFYRCARWRIRRAVPGGRGGRGHPSHGERARGWGAGGRGESRPFDRICSRLRRADQPERRVGQCRPAIASNCYGHCLFDSMRLPEFVQRGTIAGKKNATGAAHTNRLIAPGAKIPGLGLPNTE